MTAPASFTRNSADVQAMRLTGSRARAAAQGWLTDHGISSLIDTATGRLTIYGPGSRMVARLGDWLTLDERTGAFSVERGDADGPEGHERRGEA